VARACNYHVQAIRHIRHLLTTELALTLACSLILSRLDYCNVVLHRAPASSTQKLQSVQNTACRSAERQAIAISATPPAAALAPGSTTD